MFKAPTVIVVGAGASTDYGLPLGWQLRDRIEKLLGAVGREQSETAGEDFVRTALSDHAHRHSHPEDAWKFIVAAREISDTIGMVNSIDDFVNHHNGNKYIELVAKVAICWLILEAEGTSSLLNPEGKIAVPNLRNQDAWILDLWNLMRDGTHVNEPRAPFNNLSFIVFNYDRCVEVFLRQVLKQMYQLDDALARSLVEEVPIIHPYGVIGPLAGYGQTENLRPETLIELAGGIRTYGESERDARQMTQIQTLIEQAQNLIFVGFGFHNQNLDFFEANRNQGRPAIFSTVNGIRGEKQEDVRVRLQQKLLAPDTTGALKINWVGQNGAELLRNYAPRLLL